MQVELWLDVSCPWCRGALPVMRPLVEGHELLWRPIRLHPLDPAGKALTLSEDVLQFNRERERPLEPTRVQWLHHPDLAHRLLALSRTHPEVDMWSLAEALWEANWVAGLDITRVENLKHLPVPAEIWERLEEGAELVAADHQRALAIGLDGVPRFYVNGTIVPAWLDPEEVARRFQAATSI